MSAIVSAPAAHTQMFSLIDVAVLLEEKYLGLCAGHLSHHSIITVLLLALIHSPEACTDPNLASLLAIWQHNRSDNPLYAKYLPACEQPRSKHRQTFAVLHSNTVQRIMSRVQANSPVFAELQSHDVQQTVLGNAMNAYPNRADTSILCLHADHGALFLVCRQAAGARRAGRRQGLPLRQQQRHSQQPQQRQHRRRGTTFPIHIYRLLCKPTGKAYIGQSSSVRRRLCAHRNPNMSSTRMRADVRRFTPFADMFEVTILYSAYSTAIAAGLEQMEISRHGSCNPERGYDILKGHPVCDKRYWGMQAAKC